MKQENQIPAINFQNRYQKAFEFEIVSNKEFLLDMPSVILIPFDHIVYNSMRFYLSKRERGIILLILNAILTKKGVFYLLPKTKYMLLKEMKIEMLPFSYLLGIF